MLKGILIYGCLLFSMSIFGQSKKVDLRKFDGQILNQLLIDYTNELRLKKRKKPLEHYLLLDSAAINHVLYMANRKYLGHTQKSRALRTVKDRLEYFGETPEFVGENVQFISIQYEVDKSNKDLTYNQLSEIIGHNWKVSRAHYLNMINSNYTGVSVKFAISGGLLYVCQVFSSE